jgi:hypothetical protein
MTRSLALLTVAFSLLSGFKLVAAEYRGVIRRIDPARRELVIEGRGRGGRGTEITFLLAPDAEILVGGQPATPADLTAGHRAHIDYERRDGAPVARRVRATGRLGAAAAPRAEPRVPTEPNVLSGTLRRVALTDREIVVIGPSPAGGANAETTLSVPEEAPITRDGKPIQLEDLREGEPVAVRTEPRGGKLVARAIAAGSAVLPPDTPRADSRRERLHQFLKMLDGILQQMEERQDR